MDGLNYVGEKNIHWVFKSLLKIEDGWRPDAPAVVILSSSFRHWRLKKTKLAKKKQSIIIWSAVLAQVAVQDEAHLMNATEGGNIVYAIKCIIFFTMS